MPPVSKWVFRLSDGQYLRGGFYEPEFDPNTEAVEEFPDHDPHPNPALERGPGRVPKTPAQLAAEESQRKDAEAAAAVNTNRTLLGTINYLLTIINELRGLHGLPALTTAEVKAGIKDKIKQL